MLSYRPFAADRTSGRPGEKMCGSCGVYVARPKWFAHLVSAEHVEFEEVCRLVAGLPLEMQYRAMFALPRSQLVRMRDPEFWHRYDATNPLVMEVEDGGRLYFGDATDICNGDMECDKERPGRLCGAYLYDHTPMTSKWFVDGGYTLTRRERPDGGTAAMVLSLAELAGDPYKACTCSEERLPPLTTPFRRLAYLNDETTVKFSHHPHAPSMKRSFLDLILNGSMSCDHRVSFELPPTPPTYVDTDDRIFFVCNNVEIFRTVEADDVQIIYFARGKATALLYRHNVFAFCWHTSSKDSVRLVKSSDTGCCFAAVCETGEEKKD